MKTSLCLAALLVVSSASASATVEKYRIDTAHSSIGFRIRHFVTPLPGTFGRFSGTITVDRENLQNSSVEATIEVTSVDTQNERRDNHLRAADFFLVESFPKMTFKSTVWKQTGENLFDVTGDLTIKDVTKPVTLKVQLLGFMAAGNRHLSGWEATTRLDRREWNVTGGGAAVGSDVDVLITIEAIREG